MFSFPPLPPWDGMHPLVIHLPIALILVTPILVVLALVCRKCTLGWLRASALLMVLAAIGACLATSTGSAAEDYAEKVPGARDILEEHEELGEAARNFAIGLAAALVIGTGVYWRLGDKIPRKALITTGVLYLVVHGAAMLVVANASHQGGRLVHEVGVRARLNAGPVTSAPADTHQSRGRDSDDD